MAFLLNLHPAESDDSQVLQPQFSQSRNKFQLLQAHEDAWYPSVNVARRPLRAELRRRRGSIGASRPPPATPESLSAPSLSIRSAN